MLKAAPSILHCSSFACRLFARSAASQFSRMSTEAAPSAPFYSFKAKKIDGTELDFADLKGKAVLIVNTASQVRIVRCMEVHGMQPHQVLSQTSIACKSSPMSFPPLQCGFTGQYKGLQELYDKHKDQGFTILAFPCNQFGGQEPAGNDDIKSFCSLRFNVTFQLMDKVDVNGPNEIPLYTFLKKEKKQMFMERIKVGACGCLTCLVRLLQLRSCPPLLCTHILIPPLPSCPARSLPPCASSGTLKSF
jgi:glutathione peroxidase